MEKDIRSSASYQEALKLYEALRQPGSGQICDAAEVYVSPDGTQAVFCGTIAETLEQPSPTRICRIDLASGDVRVLTFGPNSDRLPKYSPDGQHIAFLSDRHKAGDFQLYLIDPASGAARAAPRVGGWVEYLHWSPDGRRILLGVAGHGADISGGQGGIPSRTVADDAAAWMPSIETGDESYRWRRAWVYDLVTHEMREASPSGVNIWEAVWCGNRALAAVTSPGASESLWYTARLQLIELKSAVARDLYVPEAQLGWPSASPSGQRVAIVEATCSDRLLVAGDLVLIDASSGRVQRLDTLGVDVTYTEWRSERHLLFGGYRGFETVVALCDVSTGTVREVWRSAELATAALPLGASGLNNSGDFVIVTEGFVRAPEIALVRDGTYQLLKSFALADPSHLEAVQKIERIEWTAADGLEMQGWLLRPKAASPMPLVLNIHGGPVNLWRPMWLGRRGVPILMLLAHGFAVFFPNPRGSSGRGQSFARQVVGDMGGADTCDHLTGIDHLIATGLVDPLRLGVMGASYGGFMTSWLITQDRRFAAAVAVAPVTNQVSEHLVSNIPHFVSMFLADTYRNLGGKYFERSPVLHAHKVKTPTLNVCGALDRCTPPGEAHQFHSALLENGVPSVLITYPQEGHGIRKLPAGIDYAARVVEWFERYLRGER